MQNPVGKSMRLTRGTKGSEFQPVTLDAWATGRGGVRRSLSPGGQARATPLYAYLGLAAVLNYSGGHSRMPWATSIYIKCPKARRWDKICVAS